MANFINIRLAIATGLLTTLALSASATGEATQAGQSATSQPTSMQPPAASHSALAHQPEATQITASHSADMQPEAMLSSTNQPATTQSPAQRFAEGSASYEAGEYAAAAEQFAQLAATYPSLAVYYNLGNSYFRLGQYGQAIAAYEKAHAINPAQPAVLANLDRTREAARIAEPTPTRWEQYARTLGPNSWTVLLVVSVWAALGLWLVPAQYRRPHGIWRPALLALSVAVLISSAIGLYPWRQLARAGTVLDADAPLLLAPVSTSPVQSYAQAGQPAQWIGSHGQFDRIRLPDGSEGWIARTQFATTWNTRR